jgi:tRNA-binding EMAP/Myf-like protein
VIIRSDAVVGKILHLQSHPNADKIWLAHVRLSLHGSPVQIVFGGTRKLRRGDLVAVAPPGAKIVLVDGDQPKKMRARNYRGQRSHGMLCSLNELGWAVGGPDEVAIFRDLKLGSKLENVPVDRRPAVVRKWNESIDAVDTFVMPLPAFPPVPVGPVPVSV